MAELIAAVAEAVVALITAFCEAMPAIVRALLYVAAVAITVVAYLVSPKFRARKQQEWKAKPIRKYLEVASSVICVAAVIAFSVWLMLPEKKDPDTVDDWALEKGREGEDLRVMIQTDLTNQYKFAVKQGGITNILGTKTFSELSNAIRQNVKVIKRDGTNESTQPRPSK